MGVFDFARTRTRTQTTDHGPRTTDRVRHQTLLSNASDHGPSPTSQAKTQSAIFIHGPSPRQNVGPRTESDIKTTLSNTRTTDRVRGLQSESESELHQTAPMGNKENGDKH
ncbi:hypothetical protein LXL04_018840 [Taraxacum kok-saghyz]